MSENPAPEKAPTYLAKTFACPNCGDTTQQDWGWLQAHTLDGGSIQGAVGFHAAMCFVCKDLSLWEVGEEGQGENLGEREARMIFPSSVRGPAPSADMPEGAARIYEEARRVANASPRSAAALTRLALEAMLDEIYPTAANLNDMIKKAAADGLSPQVVKALDVLRFNGNDAVHELHREDDLAICDALFRLLTLAVTQLRTDPRLIEEMHDAMPQSVKDAIDKRDTTS